MKRSYSYSHTKSILPKFPVKNNLTINKFWDCICCNHENDNHVQSYFVPIFAAFLLARDKIFIIADWSLILYVYVHIVYLFKFDLVTYFNN